MVRSFLTALMTKEVKGMHQAAYLLAAFALGSQALALIRDRLLASAFGAGHTLDIYYAAFRMPDFLFATVASLLSLYALLPVLSRLETERAGQGVAFLRDSLLIFFIGMGVVCGVAWIFAPQIIALIAPGFMHGDADTLVMLTRILLLQPILLGISNLFANLTQLRHRFLLYSISPLLYNVGIICGVIFFYPRFGIAGLGWGVVLGAAMHALVQAPFFFSERVEQRLPLHRVLPVLREVLALSIPRTLSLSANQLVLLGIIAIASFLSVGSISIFTFASNLQAVPIAIIGVSYSVAAFPTLSRFFAAGNKQEFVSHIETALRHIIFWSLPATVLVIVLRAYIVRAILGAGAFNWSDTRLTAAALALFMVGFLAQSLVLLIARAYYAAGNTRTPLMLALLDIVISIVSALGLLWLFMSDQDFSSFIVALLRVDGVPGGAVLMLALGDSLGAIVQCLIGVILLARDFSMPTKGLGRLFFQSFSSSIIGGACAYATLTLFGPLVDTTTVVGIVSQGAAAGVVGLFATAVVLALLRSSELSEIVSALGKRFTKPAQSIAVEPTDVS
ncbi:MAG TPA: murein biosynthesis integral membrane protein MurJ [Candidatus Paceibacterota bacterium]|nr:murein biosynthesis integral membrane protein MurJ [Candidatus Paceibacterota bacterium]